jgi:heme a synthase
MTNLKTPINANHDRFFRRLTIFTVVTVYLLIAAGGIVRSTGSGMGCPDWPKCFGSWVPPTEAYQLPSDYKELYGAKLKGEIEFNVVKTWTEYVNRLLGVFTGLLIFGTLLASVPYLRSAKSKLFYASLSAFVLVGFQGWLGSKVVSSELHPLMVTLHMIVAIIIVFILIYILFNSYSNKLTEIPGEYSSQLRRLTMIVILISFGQVILGTQVREAMDGVISQLGFTARSRWIDELGLPFYIHRSFSIIVLGSIGLLVFRVVKRKDGPLFVKKIGMGIMIVVLVEILTGIIMSYFAVPAFAQPIHLLLAIIMLGLQYLLWLLGSSTIPEARQQVCDKEYLEK